MLEKEQISYAVDGMIAKEDLPPGPGLRVLKGFSIYAGMDEDEIEAYLEFRHWYLRQDFWLLDLVPVKPFEIYCFEEPDDAISFPFGSIGRGEFSPYQKYQYKIRKVMERIQDLAQTFSCISHETGRKNIQKRYENLLYKEFQSRILSIVKQYDKYRQYMDFKAVKNRIAKQNMLQFEAKEVWNKHAYEE